MDAEFSRGRPIIASTEWWRVVGIDLSGGDIDIQGGAIDLLGRKQHRLGGKCPKLPLLDPNMRSFRSEQQHSVKVQILGRLRTVGNKCCHAKKHIKTQNIFLKLHRLISEAS